jgi:hypothetical protein
MPRKSGRNRGGGGNKGGGGRGGRGADMGGQNPSPWSAALVLFCLSAVMLCCIFIRMTAAQDRGNRDIEVKNSSIADAGLGAFALRSYRSGDTVGQYKCQVKPQESSHEGRTSYTWILNATHDCDAEPYKFDNPCRYVNTVASKDTCRRKNIRHSIRRSAGKVFCECAVQHIYSWKK